MIVLTPLRLIFITICLCVIGVEAVLSYSMYKNKNEYKSWIAKPVIAGILGTLSYCLFLLVGPEQHFFAVLFDSIFFISTDWLSMFMFLFAITYTGYFLKYRHNIAIISSICCLCDSISLFVNNFTHHMFDLVIKNDTFNHFYWANDFHFPHYIHLGMCYIMVGLTFVFFGVITKTSPKFYKSKYAGIFGAYVIVILANFTCYSLNFPIDFSVVLYGVLAGFICYYSTYTFPHKLLRLSLEAVNNTISDAVLYYDHDGNCIYANRAAKVLFADNEKFNRKKAEAYRHAWLIKHPDVEESDCETEYYTKDLSLDGKNLFLKVEYQRESVDERFAGSYMRLIDRTAEYDVYEKERYIATHDELTGIYNRNGFFEAVDRFNKKHGSENRLMLCSNIKDFKLINDFFGVEVGDSVLNKQAEFLINGSHADSIYGRLGDDRFGLYVCVENFSEPEMEIFIKGVKAITEGSVYKMHINVGVYDPQGRDESAQVMTDKALMAMSTINNDYNQIFAYYDSVLMEKLLNEKNIVTDFESAIENNQIKMYLQPIEHSDESEFGAEALCRWQHPLRGIMLPEDFLPILEKNGLIYQLDEFIWEQAFIKLSEWQKKGCNNCYISVNVSVKDFFFMDVYKTFTSLVEKYNVKPSMLHIEITESVLMSDFAKAFMLSNKLQKYGFIVAIDNFGSGYSSLNMLKDLQPSILKLDMALHKNLEEHVRNQVILIAVVDMAHSLNMKVVGEGVETKDQYEILKNLNCNIFQGNYFAEPMPASEFDEKIIDQFINKK